MRILSGKHAGRDLTSPKDFRVRPTAEHVRGALLDLLAADLKDASVLDLFAGTGALGLEALSRGAKRCDFVETRPASLHALKSNIGLLRYKDATRVFKKDAVPFAAGLVEGTYDLAFADPPYGSRMLDHVMRAWDEKRYARVLAIEHEKAHALPKLSVKPAAQRIIDDTGITIYRLKA